MDVGCLDASPTFSFAVIMTVSLHAIDVSPGFVEEEQAKGMLEQLTKLLTHKEFRVRMEAGSCVGALCARFGPATIYEGHVASVINTCIAENLERQIDPGELKELRAKLGMSKESPPDAVFYESAGWKTLETGFKCVAKHVHIRAHAQGVN